MGASEAILRVSAGMKIFVDVSQAAKLKHCAPRTFMHRYVDTGLIRALEFGHAFRCKIFFLRRDVDALN